MTWLWRVSCRGASRRSSATASSTPPRDTVAWVLAFAAGAMLTMLADTMMPEAFAYGGKAAGLLTTMGFRVALSDRRARERRLGESTCT